MNSGSIELGAVSLLLVEYWKLIRSFERSVRDLPVSKAEKVQAQIRYSAKRFEQILVDADIRLVCFDGEAFTPELPVSAANAEDLIGCDTAIIEKTLEPTLVQAGNVIHTGKVILRRAP